MSAAALPRGPGSASGRRHPAWRAALLTLLLSALTLAGCSSVAPRATLAPPTPPADSAGCGEWFAAADAFVAAAGTADAQTTRVAGFDYLRVERFLAAIDPGPSDPAFPAWAERLRRLDAKARSFELRNAGAPLMGDTIERCGRVLLSLDLASPARREALARAAVVPDDYSTLARVAGLYALTSAPFSVGVHRLHEQTRERFARAAARATPPARAHWYLPAVGAPLSPAEVAAVLARSRQGPLGVPEPAPRDLARLFETFAPTLVVDGDADYDRIGVPVVDGPRIDTSRARVYTLATHTRFAGRTLLQLVYVAWFPERPLSGPLDLLGGLLDGIVWRVTLAEDGHPLLYDVMHACGCYYMAFPGARLRQRADPPRWQEPLLVPATAPPAERGLVVELQSATHYALAVRAPLTAAAGSRYQLADYDELRALPLAGGGSRSLFRPDGIVAGSERAERWLFWPMGVPEPGALRQWGRHAIAFVGRRHFDDADLLDSWFVPAP